MGIQHPLQPGASLRILTSSGQIVVTAEERDDLDVEPPDRHVEMKDGGRTAEVKSRSGSLRVRCPKGTDVSIGVISGGVRLAGEFGSVKVSAVSGPIEIASDTGDGDVRRVGGKPGAPFSPWPMRMWPLLVFSWQRPPQVLTLRWPLTLRTSTSPLAESISM